MDEEIGFLGHLYTADVKRGLPALQKLDQAQFRALLQNVVRYIQADEPNTTELRTAFTDFDSVAPLFTVLYFIVRSAVRSRSKIEQVADEIKLLKLPPPLEADLQKAVASCRSEAQEAKMLATRTHYPTLESLQWRTDVTISTTSLLRVMRPSVTMCVRLSNGKSAQFEMSVERFSELRFQVARVLKEMQDLEKHPILNLKI